MESHRLQVTLDNFDAPSNQNNRYILTSPHSLRACARLGIKPVELLPKSFGKFVRGLDSSGLSEGSHLEAYTAYEAQRKRKLQTAKLERIKLKKMELKLDELSSKMLNPSSLQEKNMKYPLSEKDKRILHTLHNHLVRKKGESAGVGGPTHKLQSAQVQCCHGDQEKTHQGNFKKSEDSHSEDSVRYHLAGYGMKLNAAERKSYLDAKKSERQLAENKKRWTRFKESRREMEHNDSLAHQYMVQSLQHKHRSAEQKCQQLLEHREAEIKKSAERRLQRSQQCALTAQCLEQSLEKWRSEVDIHSQQRIDRAKHRVQCALAEKCSRLHLYHKKKVKEHAANLDRVRTEQQSRLDSSRWEITEWERRTEELHKERTNEIHKSRAAAYYSAQLRAKLKQAIGEQSFADKCHQAELHAALEKTYQLGR